MTTINKCTTGSLFSFWYFDSSSDTSHVDEFALIIQYIEKDGIFSCYNGL